MMKTTGLILLSFMISLSAYCQDTKDYSVKRNELNLGYFNGSSRSSTEWSHSGSPSMEESRGMNAGLGPLGIIAVKFHF